MMTNAYPKIMSKSKKEQHNKLYDNVLDYEKVKSNRIAPKIIS